MSLLLSLPVLWAQAPAEMPKRLVSLVSWLFVYGEPAATISGYGGGVLTWVKVIGLFCLMAWALSWVIMAYQERTSRGIHWLDVAALAAVVGGILSVYLHVLEVSKRIPAYQVGGQSASGLLALVSALVFLVWFEKTLWSSILRIGTTIDLYVLAGMHLALGLGLGVGILMMQMTGAGDWPDALIQGGRLGATYMGFVVLFRVLVMLVRELLALRWRRLYAIGWHSVIEAFRRMWAPWVVIVVFAVILAFTDWFLHPPRIAELGRLYIGTLTLLTSLLLTVMIAILTPISLPNDIQQQTIYTIVSKPVRRIELVWGRILGFMAIVTFLLVLFGGISLIYLYRTVHGTIVATETQAAKALQQNRPEQARKLREDADQLRTRMSARLPVKGSLTFVDSRGVPQIKGIDVGQELEYRSHIEGATQAMAIWQFGIVPDPIDKKIAETNPKHRVRLLDLRIPVDKLLRSGTVEALLNEVVELKQDEMALNLTRQQNPNMPAAEANRIAAQQARIREQSQRLSAEYEQLKKQVDQLEAQAQAAKTAGNNAQYESLSSQAAALHSLPIPLQMTFTVYRTTKGIIGDPVMASLHAVNPHTDEEYRTVFPIHEYYTNSQGLPPEILAGSRGSLRLEVQCISPTQYLGTAESDLYILAESGTFGWNYIKGLMGIWLQALVLTAIGVFAGTFLSWPVALLTTIAFFVAGQVAFGFLQDFAMQTLQGGGPFESLIRLLSHDNLQRELTPTLAVVSAKTLDAIVMPIMSRLVYVVPNFSALDVTNTVADGFAVTADQLLGHGLLAFAYAIPFSIAGYFILKNREVAA